MVLDADDGRSGRGASFKIECLDHLPKSWVDSESAIWFELLDVKFGRRLLPEVLVDLCKIEHARAADELKEVVERRLLVEHREQLGDVLLACQL